MTTIVEYCGWFVYVSASIPVQHVVEAIPITSPTVPLAYSPKPSAAEAYLDKLESSLVVGSLDAGRSFHDVDLNLRRELECIGTHPVPGRSCYHRDRIRIIVVDSLL
jgi:hypothetical protein